MRATKLTLRSRTIERHVTEFAGFELFRALLNGQSDSLFLRFLEFMFHERLLVAQEVICLVHKRLEVLEIVSCPFSFNFFATESGSWPSILRSHAPTRRVAFFAIYILFREIDNWSVVTPSHTRPLPTANLIHYLKSAVLVQTKFSQFDLVATFVVGTTFAITTVRLRLLLLFAIFVLFAFLFIIR